MWVDYIDLLVYFHKDIRNAHYICPKNLKEEHDVLMNKKDRIEAELRRQRDRERVVRNALSKKESILEFYKEKMKFFGIEIKGDGITIHPIESVTQFYQEAKAMKHCVFSNGYYKRKDCLILSARDNEGKRLETIELNLKTFDIVQSRAVCNGMSEHHDRIIQLVKKNINLIRQRIA
jgi:pyruvate-formate lyase-activating enzyme